jgi:hypothetical protein
MITTQQPSTKVAADPIETGDGPGQALQVQRAGATVTMFIATAPDQFQANAALDDAQSLGP